ncbi:MAG: PKD domain-containing protein [Bacteroidales bacterium]|nr:MAG: PKD domain-containing protein [Bacteroidales bacterium]
MKKQFTLFIFLALLSISALGQLRTSIKIGVFPIDFTDIPADMRSQWPTKSQWSSILFDGVIKQYFDTISYNNCVITGDVFDYTTSNLQFWDPTTGKVKTETEVLETLDINAPGYNPDNYDYVIFLVGHDARLGGSRSYIWSYKVNGVQYAKPGVVAFFEIGRYNRNPSYRVENSTIERNSYLLPITTTTPPTTEEDYVKQPLSNFDQTFSHELIHSLGIGAHANSRTNNGKPDYEPEDTDPSNEGNWNNEYGNLYDIMGGSGGYGSSLNGYFRHHIGFMNDDMLNIIDTYTTQTVTAYPLNSKSGKRLIAVYHPAYPTQWPGIFKNDGYTLEVRTAGTFDPMLSHDLLKENLEGLFVMKNSGLQNLLLDMSPSPNVIYDWGSFYDIRDVVLKPGMIYENSDVKFSDVIKNADGSFTVTIQVKKPEAPTANFSASETSISAGQSITFSDLSTNRPTSWSWSFAGGTPATSTKKNPVVTYTTVGTYDVSLTTTNDGGSNTKTIAGYITVNAPITPIADFSASETTIPLGQSITFTDLSSNYPTSWSWSFVDGTPETSTEQNPVITYYTTGTHAVTLTAANAGGSDTKTTENYITVIEPTDYCSEESASCFYEWISKVEVGSFINTSNATKYSDFTNQTINLNANQDVTIRLTPDFSSDSYDEYFNVWIDYNKNKAFEPSELVFSSSGASTVTGTFTVANVAVNTRMRVVMNYSDVAKACGTFDYGEVEDYSVNISIPPVANFSASATSIITGQSVTFTDLSTNTPTTWAWSFTGGTPATSTAQNPAVTYTTAGTYSVSLTATNSAGSDIKTITGYITAADPVIVPVANFSASATSITTGQSVTFTDLSTNTPTSWSWSFTGGTPATSTAQNPAVTYTTAGTYSVSLTATNSAGGDTKTITGYITVADPVVIPIANFSASATSITTGQSVTFTDLSTNSPTSWSWSFTGGIPATSALQNPVVTYSTAGTYNVSLTATNVAGNNTKTTTGYITVSSTNAVPNNHEVEDNIEISPNPSNSVIYLKGIKGNSIVKVFSLSGQIMDCKFNSKEKTIDVSCFTKGLYIIQINVGNKIVTKRFMVD